LAAANRCIDRQIQEEIMKARLALSLTCFILLAGGCKYAPFLKYNLFVGKDGRPGFSEWDRFMGSDNRFRRAYDVKHYDWQITVHPDEQHISGKMDIHAVLNSEADSLLLDLHRKLNIDTLKIDGNSCAFNRKRDALFVQLTSEHQPGDRIILTIAYSGKPVNIANEGPIQWRTGVDGEPWISTQTEGIGPHYLMPCKDLLYDEPDSVRIRVTAPANLVCAANGRRIAVTESGGFKTSEFRVSNPINIYNISINLGSFTEIQKEYTDIEGNKRSIGIYALESNKNRADTFYDQVPEILTYFERTFGTFPWWNDGCNFVESTFSAMEHQSCIAMGSDYRYDFATTNLTLVHEISHEWWGNNVTAEDYCDMWLHEGFATYSEALFVEYKYGSDAYFKRIAYMASPHTDHHPVKKTCGVRYNNWATGKDQNIYSKGALFLHTIRQQLENDTLFFQALKAIQKNFSAGHLTSKEFIEQMNEMTGKDFTQMADVYLNRLQTPTIDFYLEGGEFVYMWSATTPPSLELRIDLQLSDSSVAINPSADPQRLIASRGTDLELSAIRSGYVRYNRLKKDPRK
jgi:aminopeptidase N